MTECYVIIDQKHFSKQMIFTGLGVANQYKDQLSLMHCVLCSPTVLRGIEYMATESIGVIGNDEKIFCLYQLDGAIPLETRLNNVMNDILQCFATFLETVCETAGFTIMTIPDTFKLIIGQAMNAFATSLTIQVDLDQEDLQMLDSMIEENAYHSKGRYVVHPLILDLVQRLKRMN